MNRYGSDRLVIVAEAAIAMATIPVLYFPAYSLQNSSQTMKFIYDNHYVYLE